MVSGAAKPNSCMQCHEASGAPALKEHHAEWNESIHARMDVSCEVCHGGNAGETEKSDAHRGVYDAMDPKSTVYYTRIPELCGECHKGELSDFKISKHYEYLMSKGVGPTCVTCHDAMSTKILNPEEVELFCAVCHNTKNKNNPEITHLARGVMEKLNEINGQMAKAEMRLKNAAKAGMDIRKSRGFINLARREVLACKEHWHTFQLVLMASRLEGVENLIEQGMNSIRPPSEGM